MKITACLICLLLSLPLYAQQGLFIGANAGMGFTDMSYRRTGFLAGFGEIPHERELGFSAGIDVGFRRQRWSFQTGLGLIRTGYQYSVELVDQNAIITKGSIHYRYKHILLPLAVSYKVPVYKRLSLVPLIGTDISYNLGEQQKTIIAEREQTYNMQTDTFYRHYARVSLFGKGALACRYDLSSKIGLQAGVSARYMLTNFVKNEAVAPGSAIYHHPWQVTFDAGFSYMLPCKRVGYQPGKR